MHRASITALRDWLKTCPLIAEEQDATGAAFRIAGLEEEATAFSIEDSPTDPIVESYISGRDLAKNYLFLSRREFGETDVLTIENSGFFEQLADWVMEQNDCDILPDLSKCGHGKEARALKSPPPATSSPTAPEAAKCRCSSGSSTINPNFERRPSYDCFRNPGRAQDQEGHRAQRGLHRHRKGR